MYQTTDTLLPIRTVLSNGIVVLSEPMPHVRSVTLGFCLRAGSRHEPTHLNGITHFIEHMVFKGTKHRTARQIAIESDHLGGHVDAFTTRDGTGFYAQTLDHRMADAFDLLADLLLFPVFDPIEFERERSVILEEMKMVEDTPDELVFERFTSCYWNQHPLGRPIEGTAQVIQTLTPDLVASYYRQIYTPQNLIVTAAGNLDHAQLITLTEHYFGHLHGSNQRPTDTSPTGSLFIEPINKAGEQVHMVLGVDCPSLLSPHRYACSLLTTFLGGGLSSRLFQKIREEEGLAYTVYADINAYWDVGCLTIYAALSPDNLKKAVTLILAEIRRLIREPILEEELQRAKDQLLAELLLGLESSSSRAAYLGRQEALFQQIISVDHLIQAINAVTVSEVQSLAESVFSHKTFACSVLGPLKRHKITQELLTI